MPSIGADALNAAGGVIAWRPTQGGRIVDIAYRSGKDGSREEWYKGITDYQSQSCL